MREAFLIRAEETYELLGEVVELKVSGSMTDNQVSVVVETAPPNMGPPPHRHSREDETPTVLEGEFEFLCNGQWKTLPMGEMAFIPRGATHTFRNVGTTPGRIAATFFPAGFERFFAIFAEGLTRENAVERLRFAGESVGTTFFV